MAMAFASAWFRCSILVEAPSAQKLRVFFGTWLGGRADQNSLGFTHTTIPHRFPGSRRVFL